MCVKEQLREEIYRAVDSIEARHVGVAFSGGVDSSLLAKACRDIGKNVTLLTVGFSSQMDIENSKELSRIFGLPLLHRTVPLEELEDGLIDVLSSIEYDRIVLLENCICFYSVFRMASRYRIKNVLSANGIDELFCGYHEYARKFTPNRTFMMTLMKKQVETAKKDKEQIVKLSQLLEVKYDCPFLSEDFIEYAMKIPIGLKIRSKEDKVRKHVLREVALEIGVPRSAALRRKKAFQYSSGLHKAIQRLSRNKGFTPRKAKEAGHPSAINAYIDNLKDSLIDKGSSRKISSEP